MTDSLRVYRFLRDTTAMATAVHISVNDYLATSYRPDCDYVDGAVQERHLGSKPHSYLQTFLAQWFNDRYDDYGCTAGTELRVRVAPERVRVPDVCVVSADAPDDEDAAIETSPLVCIEVLSPEDRLPRLQERIDDFARMGVKNIWVFDPVSHQVWVADDASLRPFTATVLPVRGLPLTLDLLELFATLEKRLRPFRQ